MTVLDQFDTERITAEAREVHPGRAILTGIAAVLYVAGWVTYKVLAALWLCVAWCCVAVRVGWSDARKPTGARGPAR